MSDRDVADGYVHLARAINILPLAMKNYNYTVQLWLLKLNYRWMRENKYDIRWEWGSSNATIYPHLYDNTTKRMLLDTKTWTRRQNEKWNETSLANDTWLTDGDTSMGSSFKIGRIEQAVLQCLCIALTYYVIYF
jgi:uncharacterized protein (DUF952 family)